MIKNMTKLENALEGKLERECERGLPGVTDDENVLTIYFCVPKGKSAKVLFRKITSFTNPPFAQFGGATEVGCSVLTPSDVIFHALEIHGDLDGWYADIKAGAEAENILLAKIKDRQLQLENGENFNLEECQITFL